MSTSEPMTGSASIPVWVLVAKALGVTAVTLGYVIAYNVYYHMRPGRNGQDLFIALTLLYVITLAGCLVVQVIRLLIWIVAIRERGGGPGPAVRHGIRNLEFSRGWKACLIIAPILLIAIIALKAVSGPGPMAGTPAFVRSHAVQTQGETHGSEAESQIKSDLRDRGYTIVNDPSAAAVIAEVAVVPGKGPAMDRVRKVRLVDVTNNTVICMVFPSMQFSVSDITMQPWWDRDVYVAGPGKDGVLFSALRPEAVVNKSALEYGAYRPDLGKPQSRLLVDIEPNVTFGGDELTYVGKMESAIYRSVFAAGLDVAPTRESAHFVLQAGDWTNVPAPSGESIVSATLSLRNLKSEEVAWAITVSARKGTGVWIVAGRALPIAVNRWIGTCEQELVAALALPLGELGPGARGKIKDRD